MRADTAPLPRRIGLPDGRLLMLAALLAVASAVYLFWGLKGNWVFILNLRLVKFGALVLVGVSISVATVVFQTVTANRILTPSIMGFDALYLFLQTSLVFLLGTTGFVRLDPQWKFGVETLVMMAAAMALFGTLLGRGGQDIHRMILTGVIFGVLFRSLASFMQRLIDPNAFAVLQGASFAQFSSVKTDLLALAIVLTAAILAVIWRIAPQLDVLALGRAPAIGLGLAHRRLCFLLLALIAGLVSVSTALVGPAAFFGLLVVSLAHAVMKTHRHALLLPASAMIGALVLVAGQTVFERFLGMQSTLSVIVEFAGGLFFLILLLKGRVR